MAKRDKLQQLKDRVVKHSRVLAELWKAQSDANSLHYVQSLKVASAYTAWRLSPDDPSLSRELFEQQEEARRLGEASTQAECDYAQNRIYWFNATVELINADPSLLADDVKSRRY